MKHSRERGAAMVEFALILPLLLAMVMGMIEYGWRYERAASLNNAAFVAARTLAVHKPDADARSNAKAADPWIVTGPGNATINTPGSDCTSGGVVKVTITATLSLTSFFAPKNITATGVARCDG